jgi:peptidoglycan hydrolase CwlO-like protein
MTKRKPFTPHGQQTVAAPKSVEEVESSVSDYSAEIEELKNQVEDLKKEIAEFKERIQKNSNSGSVDPRLDKLFEALKKSPNFFLTKELL